jgi:hypothetical protein
LGELGEIFLLSYHESLSPSSNCPIDISRFIGRDVPPERLLGFGQRIINLYSYV